MTETINKRKNTDDLPTTKKMVKRICTHNENTNDASCKGQSNEKRICNIFQNEIDTEIASKIKDLETIQERLNECHKDLGLIRKAAVTTYYVPTFKKSTKLEQHRIHPAVQKLIGKQPLNSSVQDMFEHGSKPLTRHRRKEENEPKRNLRDEKNIQVANNKIQNTNIDYKVPQYIPPNLFTEGETRLPRGNRHKKHIRILVGNVSKKVTDGNHDKATHKWMIYIRSVESHDIGKDISKVRFFLHPSYKPHDVVTVPKPPFTLSRRGWGEFPVRVQLHFNNPLNKTVDILHHLQFHGVSSGPHSRSAETLANIWIYCNDPPETTRPALNCEPSEYPYDFTDSGSVPPSSSPSCSSEVSDSNISKYNSDKSGTEKTLNPFFSNNELEFFDRSECSDFSENSQEFNLPLNSDNKKYLSEELSPVVLQTENIVESMIHINTSFEENREQKDFDISEESCDKSVNITRTNNSIRPLHKYKNLIENEVSVSDTGCEKNSTLGNKTENLTKNIFSDKSNPFIDLQIDKFDDILNVENVVLNNNDIFNNDTMRYFLRDIECPLPLHDDNSRTFDKKISTSIENILECNIKSEDNLEITSELNCLENISLCDNHGGAKISRPKTPDKSIEYSDKNILTNCTPTNSFLKNGVCIESVSKCKKNESFNDVGDLVTIKTEQFDENNDIFTDHLIQNDDSDIKDLNLLIKSETDCEMRLNSDNSSYFNHNYPESSENNVEIKTELLLHDKCNKIKPKCDQLVIKEEVIEIDDYCGNWMEEVVTDVDYVTNNFHSVQSRDVSQRSNTNIITTSEIFTPKQEVDKKQNNLKDEFQDLPLLVEKQSSVKNLFGLSDVEEFLKFPVDCSSNPEKRSKETLSFSSNTMENFKLFEDIDENLLPLIETLPKNISPLHTESETFLIDKEVQRNELDSTVFELPCLNSAISCSPKPVKSNNNSGVSINFKTDAATESIRPHTWIRELDENPIENIFKETETISTNNNKNYNNTIKKSQCALDLGDSIDSKHSSYLGSKNNFRPAVTKSSPVISDLETVVSTKTLNTLRSPVAKLVKIKPKPPESSFCTTTKAINISSLGANTFPINITNNSSTPVSNTVSKCGELLMKNKAVISSIPTDLKKGSYVLKFGKQFLLPSNSVLKPQNIHIKQENISKETVTASVKKQIDSPNNLIYVPPTVISRFSVNSNKKNSILRTVPGVSLLKKNFLVTNETPLVNSSSVSTSISNSTIQDSVPGVYYVNNSRIHVINGITDKGSFQSPKPSATLIEEKLGVVSSSPTTIQSYQRTKLKPVLLKNSSQKPSSVTDCEREKKIIILNKSETKKLNFDGRITLLQNSLEKLVTDCNFTDTEKAVRWFVRGLPIITPEANQWIYKVIHPYSVASSAIFQSWPQPKQFASEWLRAKTVCRLIERTNIPHDLIWTTKQVLYWARYHGYSHFSSSSSGGDIKGRVIYTTAEQPTLFTSPISISKWLNNFSQQEMETDEFELVDVEGNIETVKENNTKQEETEEDKHGDILCGPEWNKNLGNYVRETVNKLGYKLAKEELVPGELHEGAALTVLTHAMTIFAEDLLRRSLAASFHRKTSGVELGDTYSALINRQEFDFFTNAGLGSSQANKQQ